MNNPITEIPPMSAVKTGTTARGESPRASVFVAPPAPPPSPQASSAEAGVTLEQAVGRLNEHFAQKHTDLKFQIDDVLNSVVVSVVDADDGTVLQQIPSEVALRIARYLAENNSGLIRAEA
jgi:flagellar protein FlaG